MAVIKLTCVHREPLNILYNLTEYYPATNPINTNNNNIVDKSPPLYAGDKNPIIENNNVKINIVNIWTPAPTNTHNNAENDGGLNTSLCNCFHPDSNCISSSFISLYNCISFLNILINI